MTLLASFFVFAAVVWQDPNYDEAKVGAYALEDPLTFQDGRKVTRENWPERRRELLGIFAREMYGQEPPRPETVVTEVRETGVTLAEMAVREQVRMWFRADRTGPCIDWLVVRPRHAKGPVPVVAMLNYYGNQTFLDDPEVFAGKPVDEPPEKTVRGSSRRSDVRSVIPCEMILARGYAFMTACYADVSPDPDWKKDDMRKLPYTGVFSLWGERDESRTDNVTALGAWAWALSRAVDYAERTPALDARRMVVTGCSRLGKAALLAAARDERFAACVPNQTGGGGVPLAKRNFGENVSTECTQFPHWYCKAYEKYAADPARTLTFDQHLLLACVAPRPLLVEGYDKDWFDPKGEFLSVQAASPVWRLLTGETTPFAAMPADFDQSCVGSRLGYVRRPGRHGFCFYDWQWLLDFASAALEKAPTSSFGYATWNVGHFSLGLSNRPSIAPADVPKRTADYRRFLAGARADVLGVCEHAAAFSSDGKALAADTAFADYAAQAIGPFDKGHSNGFYWKSGVELLAAGHHDFPVRNAPCYCEWARLSVGGREVCFVETHCDWNTMAPGHETDRAEQLRFLVRTFGSEPRVVVSGDFNNCVRDPKTGKWVATPEEFEVFRAAGFAAAHWGALKTWPSKAPTMGIDNVFVKGLTISEAEALADSALSDHALLRCTLTFE